MCVLAAHELEALQKISDTLLRKCPECGKLTLKRLMSAPSFRLKGRRLVRDRLQGRRREEAQSRRDRRAARSPSGEVEREKAQRPKAARRTTPSAKTEGDPATKEAEEAAPTKPAARRSTPSGAEVARRRPARR